MDITYFWDKLKYTLISISFIFISRLYVDVIRISDPQYAGYWWLKVVHATAKEVKHRIEKRKKKQKEKMQKLKSHQLMMQLGKVTCQMQTFIEDAFEGKLHYKWR